MSDIRGVSTQLAGLGGIQQVAIANLRRVKDIMRSSVNALLGPEYINQINAQARQIQQNFLAGLSKGRIINIKA